MIERLAGFEIPEATVNRVNEVYSALDYPICTTRWAEAASFAGESRQILVTAVLHLTGRKPRSSRAGEH